MTASRRRTHRVLARCAVTTVAAAALTACSAGHTASYSSDAAATDIVLASTSPAASLDFTNTGGAAGPAALMANVYETLVRIDDDGEIAPQLAESWQVSEDRTTYTFNLRRDVKFSDGRPFNAHTAAFSIDFVKQHWTNGLKSTMDVVDSATTVGDYTLEVNLAHPSSRWLWSMGTTVGAMMSPSGVDSLATNPIGTGPYTVAGFSTSESLRLAPRADYWGEPAQHPVVIRYFSDAIASTNALQAGDVDIVWAMQAPELLDSLPNTFGVTIGTTNGEVLLSMNNNTTPFDDPQVRRAVGYAVDRQAANDVVFEGYGTDTGGAPVAPTDPWFNEADYFPFDPDRARELLADSSYDGQEVVISVPSLPYARDLSELLFSQLHDVGFTVRLESVEFPAVWLSQVMGAQDYQMSVIAHVEARDIPTIFGDPDYYLGYDRAKVRELLEQADRADDPAEIMDQAVDAIMADTPALTITNLPNIVLSRPGIEGLSPTMVTDAIDLSDLRAPQAETPAEEGS